MGHGSDKLYITHSEHAGGYGDHSASSAGARKKKPAANFARLPYDCCALTLKPFETPVCTEYGTIYDLLAIIPFIRAHGTDPVTGKKLASGDLIKLNFFKNAEGAFYDPVTFKIFNEHTPLVAIQTSGNVFTRESIDRLNIKPGFWRDLVSDEPFTRQDLITIQDPLNLQGRDLSQFDYIKKDLKFDNGEEEALSGINVGATGVGSLLKKIAVKTKSSAEASTSSFKEPPAPRPIISPSINTPFPYNEAKISTNRTAASLTSTAAPRQTTTENALWDEEDLMFEAVKAKGDKGFVRLITNYGNLNVELHCDKVPKTCYNFLRLAQEDKYKDNIFHRLIAGFMIQGGDPTGTGRGGESCWGAPFEDEVCRNPPKHDDRGVLAMANHGPNTNASQWYITFRATPHLDGKHVVFGRLVGGDDVLSKIERVPVDPATNRPRKPVMVKDISVFQDPFDDYRQKLEKRLKREEEDRVGAVAKAKKKEEREKDRTTWFGTTLEEKGAAGLLETLAKSSGGIGKYVVAPTETGTARKRKESEVGSAPPKKKKREDAFASW